MQLSWNSEQQDIRITYQNLGRTLADRANTCYMQGVFDQESWHCLAQRGFWRLPVPVEYGGYGKSWWEFTAALEGVASTVKDLGFLLSIVAHIGCIRVLLEHGTALQKDTFLPTLMGGAVGATAITERSGGSDVARITTSATINQDHFLLNGEKTHITNAPIADIVVIVGRIPALGSRDITLFMLNRACTGVSFSEAEQMMGNRTSPTGDIHLHNVMITKKHILGEPGNGLHILYRMITLDRLMYGVVASAFTEWILAQSMKFANTRKAFKVRLAEHQYIQQKLTDMKMNMEMSRWVAYAALDKLLKNDEEASLMGSLAKFVGTEGLFIVAQHFVQLHGHEGYMTGPISRVLNDAIGTRIAGGTSEIQRKNLFNQLQQLSGYEVS